MNVENRIQVGDRVQVQSGNAIGKTGVVERIEGDRLQVRSDEYGTLRGFNRVQVAVLPPEPGDAGSTATAPSGGLEAALPESSPDASRLALEALLPPLEALLPQVQSLSPLPGWLAEEQGRSPRWCRRQGGEIICTTLEPEQVNGYRDRLRAGKIVAALQDAIRAILS